MAIPLGILASSLKKAISDLFNRTTSGTLGTADSGQVWSNLRGVWFANGSKATTATAASSYPIASVLVNGENATTSASVTSGTGVAFWITDTNSWWASTAKSTQESYTYQCNPHTRYTYSCSWTCNLTGGGSQAQSSSGSSDTNVGCGSIASSGCSGTATGVSGSFSPYTAYDTCTGYNYYYYLSLIKSVAGTVSNVVADTQVASMPAAIKVVTSGNTITAQAYSDDALTTPLGSAVVTTPSSPAKGLSSGIIVAPTAYNQQALVDNFKAERQ
jgi:hypothetical protein